MKMKYEVSAKRLIKALSDNNMKAQDLANAAGINKASISQYVNGSHAPSNINAGKMAEVLNVSPLWLMGFDVDDSLADSLPFPKTVMDKFGFKPVKTIRLPMLDYVACGEPRFMNEDYETYVEADADIKADYCLKAKGESMINAHILPGSILFIRKCDMVDNGEIAVVAIGDEATLKRVYYHREENLLQLVPENPMYKPLVYSGAELEQIHILGKVVRVQFNL